MGAARANISAVIGPTISQAAYEVGPEFIEGFLADDPQNARFFVKGPGDRYCLICPLLVCTICAPQVLAMPNGRAIAPIATRIGFIPIAAPPMRARLTMAA